MEIDWDVSKEDFEIITKTVRRAKKLFPDINKLSLTMDLIATHLNDCKLDLNKLLKADRFNFAHDVLGIRRYINRKTGKLMECFLPRCAAH